MEMNQGQSGPLEGDQIIQLRTSDQTLDLKPRQHRRVLQAGQGCPGQELVTAWGSRRARFLLTAAQEPWLPTAKVVWVEVQTDLVALFSMFGWRQVHQPTEPTQDSRPKQASKSRLQKPKRLSAYFNGNLPWDSFNSFH